MNCANPDCNKQILASEENEHKHLGGCTIECSLHERNRYVEKYQLSKEEVQERVSKLYQ
ncbi:MAG: hypothetical protein LRY20_00040 [Acholeplasmataceae bacterium]|nr:hypothetical protein [Acholeplasmataceae bacterium]